MKISILQLLEGAKKAEGLTVIIDVFRAFTTACYLYDRGVKAIMPVGDLEHAYSLKRKIPDSILIGERGDKFLEGFDFGNSPSQLLNTDLRGKTAIHTTSSGTQGIVNAVNADEIITGSFVNAASVAEYIRSKNPETVSLVCMGYACLYPTDEDTFCAEYIKALILGREYDTSSIAVKLKAGSGKRFFEPANQVWSPEKDFFLCLEFNKFRFVLKAEKNAENMLYLNRFVL